MAAVNICRDLGAQKNKVCHCFHSFTIYLPQSDGTRCHDLSFLNNWVLSQLFHSPLSLSSRGSFSLFVLAAAKLSWCFELWCWRRLLRVPWTARSSNQSILQEISPEYSLERPLLKLKLQYFGHLMWRTDSLEKTLMLGKIEGEEGNNRGWDGWMTSQTMDMSLSKLWELVKDREVWHAMVHGVAKGQTWLSNWTELSSKDS